MSDYKAPDWAEAYATARDEIWEKDPHYRGFLAALEELNNETDRGMALVITSFIDRMLGDIIAAFLIDNPSTKVLLSSFNAPLGTFSSKIAACHALGLIDDDEAAEIHILRKVRNEFAHQVEVTFDSGRVKDLCGNLPAVRGKDDNVRGKFTATAISILIPLLSRPKEVAQKRLAWGHWSQWSEKAKQ